MRTTCTSPLQTQALTQVILYILLSSETNRLGKTTNYYYNDRGNSDWQDELTSVNGTPLTYDANGNVLTYGNMEFEWTNGRVLSQITVNPEDPNGTADVYSYTYDESGIRSSKTVNGVTTYFTTKDGVILSQTDGTNTMYFQYDNSGNPTGFLYNGTQYFYLTNQMGDVIGITDNAGNLIATYIYGAWGEVLATTPATAGNSSQLAIADANPLRYRGYYLDQETGYYYLQSRYYTPRFARFISSDQVDNGLTVETQYGTNVFVYCENSPVNYSDKKGHEPATSVLACAAIVLSAVVVALNVSISVLTTASQTSLKHEISQVLSEFGYSAKLAKTKIQKITNTVSEKMKPYAKQTYTSERAAQRTISLATSQAVAESASETLIKEKVRKNKHAEYWCAHLKDLPGNKKVHYVVITTPIKLTVAINRIKKAGQEYNVFCRNKKSARTLANRCGGIYKHHTNRSNEEGYFKHYHPNVNKKKHIWYIG